MGVLQGLEGIAAKELQADFFFKASEIKDILDKGHGATTAGDNGALNVWKDDDGRYRCTAHRHLITIEAKRFITLAGAEKWARKWLKLIK